MQTTADKPSPHQNAADLVAELRQQARNRAEKFGSGSEVATVEWRAANLIEQQAKALSEAERYLRGVLVRFVNEHCEPVAEWKPLPDLIGMLTQFDNASTVARELKARALAAEARLAEAIDRCVNILRQRIAAQEALLTTLHEPETRSAVQCSIEQLTLAQISIRLDMEPK